MGREVPRRLEDYAKSAVAAGRFSSLEAAMDAVIEAGVERLEAESADDEHLRQALEEAVGSPVVEFDPEAHLARCRARVAAAREGRSG